MLLEVLDGEFCICKVADTHAVNLDMPWLFVGKTDTELSVVCLVEHAPAQSLAREDGWRAFRVAGQMDFGLTGVLAGLATVLAQAAISIFALSTFDTDYILVKEEKLAKALEVLELAGYEVPRAILSPEK
ncbi:MAG: ACT domain-containing protein [Desulfovibrio sp.]|uniref:ACT domain-containing protein n=1 Tax=Desulfovibrio sp. TaxID=885 RepID=UPI0039E6E04B